MFNLVLIKCIHKEKVFSKLEKIIEIIGARRRKIIEIQINFIYECRRVIKIFEKELM